MCGKRASDFLLTAIRVAISGAANLIAAVKLAKYLELSTADWVVTVATDSVDLYRSRLDALTEERGSYCESQAEKDYALFTCTCIDYMKELGHYEKKAIHNLKYVTWVEQQGRDVDELRAQVDKIDALIDDFNARVGLATTG
jgi:hypothetical protein